MVERKLEIEHNKFKDTMVATAYFNLKDRKEIKKTLDKLKKHISEEYIMGPGFSIFRFITSFKEGFDIEVGFPVSEVVENDIIKTRIKLIPAITNQIAVGNCILAATKIPAMKASESQKSGIPS